MDADRRRQGRPDVKGAAGDPVVPDHFGRPEVGLAPADDVQVAVLV